MKRLYILLLLLLTALTLSAQKPAYHRGVALGADHDTLKFIIGSPFDNWYLYVGGGLQTFIGNEVDASARRNKLNFNLRAELGKWLIPDVAVSIRFSYMTVDGQSRYGRQPFIDFTNVPTHIENGVAYYEYQPFHAQAFNLLSFATLDWTNLFNGYERGRKIPYHWYSYGGLGASMLFGTQKNPLKHHEYDAEVGDFRRNFELTYCVGLGMEYIFSPTFALDFTAEVLGSESTWDWSPYVDWWNIFDIIPSINVTAKINLLKHVTKRHPEDGTNTYDTVYHEWLAFGSSHTVERLENKIEHISHERDSIRDLADKLADDDARKLDSLDDLLNKLNNDLDLAKKTAPPMEFVEPDSDWTPKNIFDELMQVNRVLNLPATIVYYELDKYYLDYNARVRLQEFAHDASVLDDTIEFYIIGAADSLTGSIKHNQWLSERRSEAALNFLTKNLGMSRNQFVRVSAGGIMEYKIKEQNRMAMVIQKTPITEEIVDRWLRRARERLRNADR